MADWLTMIVLPKKRNGQRKFSAIAFNDIAHTICCRGRGNSCNRALFVVVALDIEQRIRAVRHGHVGPPIGSESGREGFSLSEKKIVSRSAHRLRISRHQLGGVEHCNERIY